MRKSIYYSTAQVPNGSKHYNKTLFDNTIYSKYTLRTSSRCNLKWFKKLSSSQNYLHDTLMQTLDSILPRYNLYRQYITQTVISRQTKHIITLSDL